MRPQDGPGLAAMVESSTPEDVRLRFRSGFVKLPAGWPERLSQIDYDREMALVAQAPDGAIVGVSRLAADPEGETAEFALMVRSDHQARGLGRLLLGALLDYAAARGLREVWGDVARDNGRMLEVAKAFGFSRRAAEEFERVRVGRDAPSSSRRRPKGAPNGAPVGAAKQRDRARPPAGSPYLCFSRAQWRLRAIRQAHWRSHD